MGNRTVVRLKQEKTLAPSALYLHWHGGPESVNAFFNATYDFMAEQYRSNDLSYFHVRLTQCIGHFIGGALSFGSDNNKVCNDGLDHKTQTLDVGYRANDIFEDPKMHEKYGNIYDQCLNYLRSTVAPTMSKEVELQGVEREIERLLKHKERIKENIKTEQEYKEQYRKQSA